MSLHAAVDLGASSGRVVLGDVGRDHLRLHEVARFRNGAVPVPVGPSGDSGDGGDGGGAEHLHWDVLGLWRDAVDGLAEAARRAGEEPVASVGVDTWAVDYALLDARGTLLGNPRSYRDPRTEGVPARVDAHLSPERLYERNGLQRLPFTTLYQLVAERGSGLLERAGRLLLLPDLLGCWLSGVEVAESTNASTTGLADVRTGRWAGDLLALAGVAPALLPEVVDAGTRLGPLRPALARRTGLGRADLVAVGSHDTASAVVAVPAADERSAYVVCGTWGLVGVELEEPVLTPASLAAGFTNERGVDGRVRYLHNVMGLWVLQCCLAEWRDAGREADADLGRVLPAAAALPPGGPTVDVDHPSFLAPGPMVARLRRACEEAGTAPPQGAAAVVRCVLDSLARAFADALESAVRLSGRDVDVVHLVGGGARNELLCRLTADACGRPVVAGPVEATALGSVLVQARATGTVSGDLEGLRALVRSTQELRRYEPGAPG